MWPNQGQDGRGQEERWGTHQAPGGAGFLTPEVCIWGVDSDESQQDSRTPYSAGPDSGTFLQGHGTLALAKLENISLRPLP